MPFTQRQIQDMHDLVHDVHGVPRGFFGPPPLVGSDVRLALKSKLTRMLEWWGRVWR